MYYCCGITDKGIMPHNEDAMLLHHSVMADGSRQIGVDAPFIVAVCDGVSGEQAGELASRNCLLHLAQTKYTRKYNLKRRILEIHNLIAEDSRGQNERENMQTTLCGVAFDEDNAMHCFNVGDSRLYRYRSGSLEQLSRDQTLVQMLYEEGTITSEEKKVHSHRNIILPVIGNIGEEPKPDLTLYPDGLLEGDLILLCSDGLSDYVSDFEMEEILALPQSLSERLRLLAARALHKGGKDNVTIIAVVRYPDGIPLPPCQILGN